MTPPNANLAAVIQLIWSRGEISRADIARTTGLSRSTVSSLVQQLLAQGSVVEARVGSSGGGRPPVLLRFAHDRYQLLALDIGASHVTAAVVSPQGRILARARRSHPAETDPTGTLKILAELGQQVLDEAASADARLLGIGAAVPCPVHAEQPGHLSPSILPAWKGIDLGRWLSDRWHVPAYLENDANLGALGEHVWGLGRGSGDIAYVKLATGVGAGLIVGGRIYRGAEGIAGEIGHTSIDASGPPCRCGLSGCLEAMIGSHAIESRYAECREEAGLPPAPPCKLQEIATRAAAGDPLATSVISEAGRYLGIGLANLLNIVNPSRVILGGRLTQAGEALLAPLRTAIRARAMWTNVAAADVVISELGDRAIPLGAATLVLRTALADPRRLELGLPSSVPRLRRAAGSGPQPAL